MTALVAVAAIAIGLVLLAFACLDLVDSRPHSPPAAVKRYPPPEHRRHHPTAQLRAVGGPLDADEFLRLLEGATT